MPRTKSQPINAWQAVDEQHKYFAEAIDARAHEVRRPGDIDVQEFRAMWLARTGTTISMVKALNELNSMTGATRIARCYDSESGRSKTVWRPIK